MNSSVSPSLSTVDCMSVEEARNKHDQLKTIHGLARTLLLEMRDRSGWKALGYTSFEEYGEKEWNYSQSYIYRLSKAEEIQASLDSPLGEIPETHLRPLGAVPEDERQAIFAEANRKAEEAGKERTAKMVEEAVNEWREKAEKAHKWGALLEKDFNKMVEEDVKSAIKDKEKELSEKLQEVAKELEADYQRKIDHQTDTISRLKEQLELIKNSAETEKNQQKLAEINSQIETKKTILDALQKQQDEAFEYRKRNDDLALQTENLAKIVNSLLSDLRLLHCYDPEIVYPEKPANPVSNRVKNKFLLAAQTFTDTARFIQQIYE